MESTLRVKLTSSGESASSYGVGMVVLASHEVVTENSVFKHLYSYRGFDKPWPHGG